MRKSPQRAIIAFLFVLLSYFILYLYKKPNFLDLQTYEVGSLVGYWIITSIIAGFVSGMIAPYSRKKLNKMLSVLISCLSFIGSLLLLIYGDPLWDSDTWTGLIILISLSTILISVFGTLLASIGAIYLGQSIGLILGKKIQEDYRDQDELDRL